MWAGAIGVGDARSAGQGCAGCLEQLLQAGTPINGRSDHDLTLLMWVAGYGHEPAARLLLDRGADIDARDIDQHARVELVENPSGLFRVHALIHHHDAAQLCLLLAALAAPALRHRMAVNFSARAEGVSLDAIIARLAAKL